VEIISWLDDHSRYALNVTAHQRITGQIVLASFRETVTQHGIPASTLTDNGMVYTTRLSGEKGGRNGLETELRRLNITQKNSRPNHPTTCGKVERFQQTLKKWLRAQPVQPTTLAELQALLDASPTNTTTAGHTGPCRTDPPRPPPTPPAPKPPRPQTGPARSTTASAPTASTTPASSPSESTDDSTTSASDEPTPEPTSSSSSTTYTSESSTPPPANSSANSPSTPPRTTNPPADHQDPPPKETGEPTKRGFTCPVCPETSHWGRVWDSNPRLRSPAIPVFKAKVLRMPHCGADLHKR
jgi:hypothetical protein